MVKEKGRTMIQFARMTRIRISWVFKKKEKIADVKIARDEDARSRMDYRQKTTRSRHLTSGTSLSVLELRRAAFASESLDQVRSEDEEQSKSRWARQSGLEAWEAEGAKSSKKVAKQLLKYGGELVGHNSSRSSSLFYYLVQFRLCWRTTNLCCSSLQASCTWI